MAPKEDKEQNTEDDGIIIDDALFWSRLSLFQQIQVVDQGDPQPDDELKMEQIAAAVAQFPDCAQIWGPDGIPPNGYPRDDPRRSQLQSLLRLLLNRVPEQDIDTPQKLRIWDLLQDKYNL